MGMKATILYIVRKLKGCTTIVWVEILYCSMLLGDAITNS